MSHSRWKQQETLVKLCQIDPEVDRTYDLVQQFAQMLRTRTGEHLDTWLAQVQSSALPKLQSFATGIEKDKDAVKNGLTWWINNGMVEGHVTKLKLIKRQGYGKAGFPLLAPGGCCMHCSVFTYSLQFIPTRDGADHIFLVKHPAPLLQYGRGWPQDCFQPSFHPKWDRS